LALVRHDVLRTVAQEQHDGIALVHTQGLQAGGESVAGAVQVGPAEHRTVPNQGRDVGPLSRMHAQG
jgi:hypothetical protein